MPFVQLNAAPYFFDSSYVLCQEGLEIPLDRSRPCYALNASANGFLTAASSSALFAPRRPMLKCPTS
jgi:hypothetical protein